MEPVGEKFDERSALEEILGDPDVISLYGRMSGKLGPAAFYQRAVELLTAKQISAMESGYLPLALMYGKGVRTARKLLEHELAIKPLHSPTDADSRVICNAETGLQQIVVGGVSQEGGYSITVSLATEN